MEAIKRIGRNTFTIQYKKQKMIFTAKDIEAIKKEVYNLIK